MKTIEIYKEADLVLDLPDIDLSDAGGHYLLILEVSRRLNIKGDERLFKTWLKCQLSEDV